MAFREVILTGTPYQRGLCYGRVCQKEISISIQNYQELFLCRRQLSWSVARRLARRFLPSIRELDASYVEEMQGIADGSGFALDEILAINARTELLHTPMAAEEEQQECTAFSAVPPASAQDTVLAGQTWDFARLQRDAVVIVRIPGDETHPSLLFFPEAGMIGGKGMNSAGLSLTLNALRTEAYDVGLPIHIRMRKILECTTLHEAYAHAIHTPIPAAANLILTHRDGISLGLELDPTGVDVLLPDNGVLVHTNHFIGPRLGPAHGHSASGSTYIRLQRARQLFCGKTDITVETAKTAFQDHKGYPTSICSHPTGAADAPDISQNATNFGLIMDLTHGFALLATGNPCESPYEILSVEHTA